MTRFILNDQEVSTDIKAGTTVLDFVRYNQHLKGTKIGCREGDCGACTVLVGSLENGKLAYKSVTSCLMPLGNAAGKHLVTIEGLNLKELSPVQQNIVNEGGTQCGFCTVGFVVSLTGYCMQPEKAYYPKAIAAMDGNICRCTGYKSLERAATNLVNQLSEKNTEATFDWLIENNFLPAYFKTVPEKLKNLQVKINHEDNQEEPYDFFISGGTDLLVQKPELVGKSAVKTSLPHPELKGISRNGDTIVLGGGTTVEEMRQHPEIKALFPELYAHLKLVSSTQVRNMGTLAGNFANASPIGDLTIFFLVLNSTLILKKGESRREILLKDLYLSYKTLAKEKEELIEQISFKVPAASSLFNFEKISKRMHLDIASVNSAIQLKEENNLIQEANVSAGGVGPIPFYLTKTSEFLKGKTIAAETIKQANEIAQAEINPISDARGTAQYKRLLFRQLLYAHFLKFFPDQLTLAQLV